MFSSQIKAVIEYIRELYQTSDFIPLHEPKFFGNEKNYVIDCLDSTFVSSVGKYVDQFEKKLADFTGAKYAVATINGTSALHIALLMVGVNPDDEVITQPLSFVATCNAVSYCQAKPVFVDVDLDTLGMSPESLDHYLVNNTKMTSKGCFSTFSGRRIAAVVPMHTFGNPCRILEISEICKKYEIPLVEDAAESLGSSYIDRHTGTFGRVGVFSFNGNKTITTGSGGMIVTDDEFLAKRAKHVTTTAKVPHAYEFVHDEIGFNYRLSNINAALGCAQMENISVILENKREIAKKYEQFFSGTGFTFLKETPNGKSNYWLNALILNDQNERNIFLKELNQAGVMARPIWRLMNELTMFRDSYSSDLKNSKWLEERVVNIPSSAII